MASQKLHAQWKNNPHVNGEVSNINHLNTGFLGNSSKVLAKMDFSCYYSYFHKILNVQQKESL